jgi:hypothetical protein
MVFVDGFTACLTPLKMKIKHLQAIVKEKSKALY